MIFRFLLYIAATFYFLVYKDVMSVRGLVVANYFGFFGLVSIFIIGAAIESKNFRLKSRYGDSEGGLFIRWNPVLFVLALIIISVLIGAIEFAIRY